MLLTDAMNVFKSVNIRTVNKDTLVDASNFQFDNSLTPDKRVMQIFNTICNPYCFRVGDTAVKLEFAENGQPLQNVMTSFLLRQKSGL